MEHPEAIEKQESPQMESRADLQTDWMDSRLGLGAYPEEEYALTVRPELQAKGLDEMGNAVKDARIQKLEEARVQFVARVEAFGVRAGAEMVQDGETPPDFSELNLGLDLGPLTASVALSPQTLFKAEHPESTPSYTLAVNQGPVQGQFTFTSESGDIRLFKGELKVSDGPTFKLEGTQVGQEHVQVISLSAKAPIDLGPGKLTVEAGVNVATGEKKARAEYRLTF